MPGTTRGWTRFWTGNSFRPHSSTYRPRTGPCWPRPSTAGTTARQSPASSADRRARRDHGCTTRCTHCASSCKTTTRSRADEQPPSWDVPAAYADRPTTSPTAGSKPGRRLIAAMLLAAAALDLARCGLFVMTALHPAPAAGQVATGLAAAALSGRTARGCQAGQRWAGWAALVVFAVSAPQAATCGVHTPYTIPDTATAVLGVLLAVAGLATAGPTRWPGHNAESPCLTAWPPHTPCSAGAAGRP